MKRSRKVTRIIVVVLAIAIMIGAVVALCLMNREQALEKIQNEALIELEKKKGEYDESSIVLYETSPVGARQLAEKLGATLRISKNGRFAALALPNGTTILDVYAGDANREYIEKMSADYSVRVAELTDAEEEKDSGRLPIRPNYNVSADDLLGVGEIEKSKKIEEYREKDLIFNRAGKSPERVALWRESKKEFPNDLSVMYWSARGFYFLFSFVKGHKILTSRRPCDIINQEKSKGIAFIIFKNTRAIKWKRY